MITVLNFHQRDRDLALQLLQWMKQIGTCRNHELTLQTNIGTTVMGMHHELVTLGTEIGVAGAERANSTASIVSGVSLGMYSRASPSPSATKTRTLAPFSTMRVIEPLDSCVTRMRFMARSPLCSRPLLHSGRW